MNLCNGKVTQLEYNSRKVKTQLKLKKDINYGQINCDIMTSVKVRKHKYRVTGGERITV